MTPREPAWVRSEASRRYFREEWGRLEDDDRRFFEFLCLEVFEAGLSWDLVMRKRDDLRAALDGFDFVRVARYDDARLAALLDDPCVVRNERKLGAIVRNARAFEAIVRAEGSFLAWLVRNAQRDRDGWLRLMRSSFSFVGPELVREFLESSGVVALDGSWTESFADAVESGSRGAKKQR